MTARRGGCGNSWRRSGRGDGARGAADMPDRARPAVRLGSARRSGPNRTAPDRPRSSARRSRPSGQGRAGPGSAAAAGAVSARGRPRPGAQRRPPAPTGPYLTQTRRRPSSAAWRRRWRPGWSPRTTSWWPPGSEAATAPLRMRRDRRSAAPTSRHAPAPEARAPPSDWRPRAPRALPWSRARWRQIHLSLWGRRAPCWALRALPPGGLYRSVRGCVGLEGALKHRYPVVAERKRGLRTRGVWWGAVRAGETQLTREGQGCVTRSWQKVVLSVEKKRTWLARGLQAHCEKMSAAEPWGSAAQGRALESTILYNSYTTSNKKEFRWSIPRGGPTDVRIGNFCEGVLFVQPVRVTYGHQQKVFLLHSQIATV